MVTSRAPASSSSSSAPPESRPSASASAGRPDGAHAHRHGSHENPALENKAPETTYRLHRRFDRLGRLLGDGAVNRLMDARVVVFGCGGVGSFAAESLARSAIGHLMLVDFDDVCVTNANRQLPALMGHIGKPKVWVMRDRLRLINPSAKIESKRAFYNAARADELLTPPAEWGDRWDFVVDAIDNMTAKAHLLAECRRRQIPVVSSMGAAGKLDPTKLRTADLAEATVCPMARELRSILRKKYEFPVEGPMGLTVVYSTEHRHWPKVLTYDHGEGFSCVCPKGDDEVKEVRENLHSCDEKTLIDGSVSYVTGSFGLGCAAVVVNTLTDVIREEAEPAQSKFASAAKKQDTPGAFAAADDEPASCRAETTTTTTTTT